MVRAFMVRWLEDERRHGKPRDAVENRHSTGDGVGTRAIRGAGSIYTYDCSSRAGLYGVSAFGSFLLPSVVQVYSREM